MSRYILRRTNFSLVLFLCSFCLLGCSATGKVIKNGDKALERGNHYAAAREYLAALQLKPGHSKALQRLAACSKAAYDQKLQLAEGYRMQGSLENALAEFEELDDFVNRLRRNNSLDFVPINIEEAIKAVSSGAAEKRYLEAERLFDAGAYLDAIKEYKAALDLTTPYKNSTEKIAESHYRIAEESENSGRFRFAAEHFQNSIIAARSAYKDARNRAAMIYYHLGKHFFQRKNCRNAYDDLMRARSIMTQLDGINELIMQADECATVRIAFAEVENLVGRDVAGMDLGDFIFESIKSKTQAGASRFIRLLDREQLTFLLREQRIGAASLTEEGSNLTTLEGVDYLIFGKINQVHSSTDGLKKTTVKDTYRYSYDEKYINSEGKTRTRIKEASADMYYSLFEDGKALRISGAIRVVGVSTGAVLINHQISEEQSDKIRYADEPRLGHNIDERVALPHSFVKLYKERRELEDEDTMVKRMIESIASEMSEKILSTLDRKASVSDPATLSLAN